MNPIPRRTTAILAAAEGDETEVAAIVDSGVDPDLELAGETALTCAAHVGDLELMTLLLDKGATADTDAPCAALTVLPLGTISSAEASDIRREEEAMRLLLDRGGPGGPSPLTAAWSGRTETVRLLLDHGADPDHSGRVDSDVGVATRTISFSLYAEDVPEGLLPDTQSDEVDNVPPLIGAVSKGQLDAGADPNLVSDEAISPILAAAVRGDEAMVELLLSRGADATPTVRSGVVSPAEGAREAGHPEVAALLGGG